MSEFEQVSSDGHQMSLAGGPGSRPGTSPCLEGEPGPRRGEACTLISNESCVMVT